MKKITLTLFLTLAAAASFGQTYTTGTQVFSSASGLNYSGKVDISATAVTITMIGPSARWMCMGFTAAAISNMSNADIVSYSDEGFVDRNLGGIGVYPEDASQDWTVSSNTVASGVRTIVATRALNTGEAGDYVFAASTGSLNLIWSRAASNTMTLQPHGGLSNAGNKATNLTLGMDDFKLNTFKMYPNPAKGFTTVVLPENVTTGTVKIYDTLGRVVKKVDVSTEQNTIDTSELTTGSYMVVLRTDYGNATKTLLVN